LTEHPETPRPFVSMPAAASTISLRLSFMLGFLMVMFAFGAGFYSDVMRITSFNYAQLLASGQRTLSSAIIQRNHDIKNSNTSFNYAQLLASGQRTLSSAIIQRNHDIKNSNDNITTVHSNTTVISLNGTADSSKLLFNTSCSCWMSNYINSDGFGSQYQEYFAAAAVAAVLGLNFAFTIPQQFEHNYNNDPGFVSRLNGFAGLANACYDARHLPIKISETKLLQATSPSHAKSLLSQFDRTKCNNFTSHTMYRISPAKLFLDSHPHFWNIARSTLRRAYFSTPKPPLSFFAQNVPNVIVYQRRKNVQDNRHTILPNEYYFDVMQQVRKRWPTAVFHVLSQRHGLSVSCSTVGASCKLDGKKGFQEFLNVTQNTSLQLDLSLEETFHSLVSADVLVGSTSSFSFAAAVLSVGEVWQHAFWHVSPPGKWITCTWSNKFVSCEPGK
jgi:hypothetical protein